MMDFFNREINETEILSFLEGKYGCKFTIKESYAMGIDQSYDEFVVVSDSFPDTPFKVFRSYEDDTVLLEDDYFGLLIKEKYTDICIPIIDRTISDYDIEVSFMNDIFDNSYTTSEDLEKAINNDDIIGIINLTIPEKYSDKEESLKEKIRADLKNEGLRIVI